MQCPACGTVNEAGRKFCHECGAKLAAACPSCGSTNPPGARFCGECGAKVGVAEAPAASPLTGTAQAPVAERRLVTVLFADLVGFTTLAEGRDAEALAAGRASRVILERLGADPLIAQIDALLVMGSVEASGGIAASAPPTGVVGNEAVARGG